MLGSPQPHTPPVQTPLLPRGGQCSVCLSVSSAVGSCSVGSSAVCISAEDVPWLRGSSDMGALENSDLEQPYSGFLAFCFFEARRVAWRAA